MKVYGAKLVLMESVKGMKGVIVKADELQKETEKAFAEGRIFVISEGILVGISSGTALKSCY